ncbi:gastric triacylglycerol lipase-like protein, partial [Leptotrombidium deliense]
MDLVYHIGGEFFPSNCIINYIAKKFCEHKFVTGICSSVIFLFTGYDTQQMNKTRLPVYVAHTPSPTSVWNVIHFGQLVVSNKFRKFDFGTRGNLKHYGTRYPPEYDL